MAVFLGLKWRLDPDFLVSKSTDGKTMDVPSTDPKTWRLRSGFYVMFVLVGLTVGLALFPEIAFQVDSLRISVARIFFVISIVVVISFLVNIIHTPPKRDKGG